MAKRTNALSPVERAKQQAAGHAMVYVQSGMKIGLGTGSTVNYFLDFLGAAIGEGLQVSCVPTSKVTARKAEALKIPLIDLDDVSELDITIDGADECDPHLRLIKGGGGALLREKIVAAASKRLIIIADEGKYVEKLGAFPLPIEILEFGMRSTILGISFALREAGCQGSLAQRLKKTSRGEPGLFRTDSGNIIIDCALEEIKDPETLHFYLSYVPGVVEHGLFLDMAETLILGSPDGVRMLGKEHLSP